MSLELANQIAEDVTSTIDRRINNLGLTSAHQGTWSPSSDSKLEDLYAVLLRKPCESQNEIIDEIAEYLDELLYLMTQIGIGYVLIAVPVPWYQPEAERRRLLHDFSANEFYTSQRGYGDYTLCVLHQSASVSFPLSDAVSATEAVVNYGFKNAHAWNEALKKLRDQLCQQIREKIV